jgi:hypothetical protein
MVGLPGPELVPFVRLISHAPTVPLYETQVSVAQGAPIIMPELNAPLVSWSSTVAIACEANPEVNRGAAASATAVRSFLFIILSQKDQVFTVEPPRALLITANLRIKS